MLDREIPHHLNSSIEWYEWAAKWNRIGYLGIKLFQLIVTAAIPVVGLTASTGPGGKQSLINSALAGVLLVAEGVQQTMQFQARWTQYRAASNDIRIEKTLLESGAGDYAKAEDPMRLFCERAIIIMSREHSAWTALQQSASEKATK